MYVKLTYWELVDNRNPHFNVWKSLNAGYLESFEKNEDPNITKPFGAETLEKEGDMNHKLRKNPEHIRIYNERLKTYGIKVRYCKFCKRPIMILSCENWHYKCEINNKIAYFCSNEHRYKYKKGERLDEETRRIYKKV